MQINVECPSCFSRFQLNRDLIGKNMRCPVCTDPFTVQELVDELAIVPVEELPVEVAVERPAVTRVDVAPPPTATGMVGDLVQLVQASGNPEPQPLILETVVQPEEEIPVVALAEEVIPSEAPKEVKWSASMMAPPPPPEVPQEVVWNGAPPPPAPTVTKFEEPPPAKTVVPSGKEDRKARRKRRVKMREEAGPRPKRRRGVMIVLVVFILGSLGSGAYFLKRYFDLEPKRMFDRGKKDYEENRPQAAAKQLEELLAKHPNVEYKHEARFFLELSSLKSAVYSLTNSSNPTPALERLKLFNAAVEDEAVKPFAARNRFGQDVWQVLGKLAEDIAAKGKRDFDQDKPDETEQWITALEDLKPVIGRYRPDKVELEDAFHEIDGLKSKVAAARKRLEGIAMLDAQLVEPDDEHVEAARAIARSYRLDTDPAVVQRLNDAEKKIRDRFTYKRFDPSVAPKPLADDGLTGLLFAPRLDAINPLRPPPAGGNPGVFFAVARGMLYALDENTGKVRWATRVGIDCDTAPLRVPAGETHPELALVTVNDGVRSSLTARIAANGEALWSQPLEGPALGQPVLVGNRAFVPLKDKPLGPGQRAKNDDSGVVLEVEIGSGFLLGKLALGRPLGAGALRRPGTGLIYLTAEAKGVYVVDVEKQDMDGNRLDPQLLGVLSTDHQPGTLRGTPVLANIEGDTPGPRYPILSQADGLNEMKLRAFPLPIGEVPKGPQPPPVEIKLNGWSWFAPHCDGERLAVVTDRGEFGLFGINQAGNDDAPLFSLPPDFFRIPQSRLPSRGQVVHAEEGAFWVLVRGQMVQLRNGLNAAEGIKLMANGSPVAVGEPLHEAQLSARKDAFVLVTQQPGTSACTATCIELRSGEIRWKRQLGMMGQSAPIRIGESVVAIDRDCGVYRIDVKKLDEAGEVAWLIDDRWLVATPLTNVQTPPELLPGPDGKSAYAVAVVETEKALRLMVRRFAVGEVTTRGFIVPAFPAGRPILVGTSVVIPLANGSLYRVGLGDSDQVEEGPSWRNERLTPEAHCRLVAISEEDFFASDGGRILNRWHWPAGQKLFEGRARLTWTEKIEGELAAIGSGESARVCLVDAKNAVSIWDAAKPIKPLRIWRGGDKGFFPAGTITNGPFAVHPDPAGPTLVGFTVAGKQMVLADPDKEAPLWVSAPIADVRNDGFSGNPAWNGKSWMLTDRAGWFQLLDAATGQPIGKPASLPGNLSPAAPALQLDEKRLIVPLADGTLLLYRRVEAK